MTREEAIEQLKWYFEYDNGLSADKETVEAYKMAIQALSQEPCDKCVYSTKDGYCQYDDITETIPSLDPCKTCGYAEGSPFCLQYCPYDAERKKEQEPCTDAVSRKAVDELSKELVHITRDKADFLCNFWERLQKLPLVNPQPCDDAISRDVVIERLKRENKILYTPTGLNYLIKVIEGLPPVTLTCEEREKGECPWYAG